MLELPAGLLELPALPLEPAARPALPAEVDPPLPLAPSRWWNCRGSEHAKTTAPAQAKTVHALKRIPTDSYPLNSFSVAKTNAPYRWLTRAGSVIFDAAGHGAKPPNSPSPPSVAARMAPHNRQMCLIDKEATRGNAPETAWRSHAPSNCHR